MKTNYLPLVTLLMVALSVHAESTFVWDPKGYLMFCLNQGALGTKVEQFLGALAFAKTIDRTLILTPFKAPYKNRPFKELFKVEPINEYHRSITLEDFMENLAEKHWPVGNRTGMCLIRDVSIQCTMAQGKDPYWNQLGLKFDNDITSDIKFEDHEGFKLTFPADKYPVVAMRSPPAIYPIRKVNVPLFRYLKWADEIQMQAEDVVTHLIGKEKFVGIHLRNSEDWIRSCQRLDSPRPLRKFLGSAQCTGYDDMYNLTEAMCNPPVEEVVRLTKKVVEQGKAKFVYVVTDKHAYIEELEAALKSLKVTVLHYEPLLMEVDLAALTMADYYIGNCISSLSSIVSQQRNLDGKPVLYWDFEALKKNM